jgi:hypothetical protein
MNSIRIYSVSASRYMHNYTVYGVRRVWPTSGSTCTFPLTFSAIPVPLANIHNWGRPYCCLECRYLITALNKYCEYIVYCILSSCYIRLTLNICSLTNKYSSIVNYITFVLISQRLFVTSISNTSVFKFSIRFKSVLYS